MAKAAVCSKAVVLLLLTCCLLLLYVLSSFAIILMGKRELVALLSLSSRGLVIVVWLFLAVPWVCLQFVTVVFPDHTHLLFFILDFAAAVVFDCVLVAVRLFCASD